MYIYTWKNIQVCDLEDMWYPLQGKEAFKIVKLHVG